MAENKKVIKGNVRIVKPSLPRRIFNTFISEDVDDIGDYILYKALIPALKNMVVDTVNTLLGGGHSYKRNFGGIQRESRSYSEYYQEKTRMRDRESKPNYNYNDYIYETREEAIEILERMGEELATYDIVKVADFYEFSGVTPRSVDFNYGWTRLDQARVVPYQGGYKIRLPRPIPID